MDEKQKDMMGMLRMAILALAIIGLFWTTSTLIKNKDIIQSDPLIFGMNEHGFDSCQCIDGVGKLWKSNGTGFIHQSVGEGWINYSDFDIGLSNLEVGENRAD